MYLYREKKFSIHNEQNILLIEKEKHTPSPTKHTLENCFSYILFGNSKGPCREIFYTRFFLSMSLRPLIHATLKYFEFRFEFAEIFANMSWFCAMPSSAAFLVYDFYFEYALSCITQNHDPALCSIAQDQHKCPN
jgi:hypothetical protein